MSDSVDPWANVSSPSQCQKHFPMSNLSGSLEKTYDPKLDSNHDQRPAVQVQVGSSLENAD